MGIVEEGSISLGPWGGPGGDHWSFEVSRGVIGIIIHQGSSINSISFIDANGHHSGTFGGKDHNDLGQEKKINIVWPSEYLISVSGSYGNYKGLLVITSLSFSTNLKSHGPFGSISGTTFSIPLQDSVIIGFHGRGGYYLDALGIYVKPGIVEEGSISLGPWGGPGGDHWSFEVSRGVIGIIIHQGSSINSISFIDANGHHSGTFGGKDHNDLGQEKKINILWPSEYLMSISGSFGNYKGLLVITSLSFRTNITSYGPFGLVSGATFSIPMQDSVVVGFHGRSGYYLDALGIYVKPGAIEGSISFGAWGGPGGNKWSFKASNAINEIVVHDGLNIKSISFGDASGKHSLTFGGNNPQDIGEKKTIEIDWPSERLMSISGTIGLFATMSVITSLSFSTNLKTYGPFGRTTGTSFSIPIIKSMIVGFHGRAGHYLDALGIFVKPDYIARAISISPWGGSGGDTRHFIASRAIIQIIIRHGGGNIKSIAFRDTSGMYSGKFGGLNPNDIGDMTKINIDWPSEYLKSATGTFGDYKGMLVITSLSLVTNRTTFGPYGTALGTSFSIPMEGNIIIGFHVRAGHYLDAIGFYVRPLVT